MSTVYIVTSGSYSDYQINAVFSTRELAQSYCDLHNRAGGDDYGHDEWDVDADADRKMVESGRIYWTIFEADREEEWSQSSFAPSQPTIEEYTDRYGRLIIKVDGIVAPNKESAIKIAAERRAQFLAEQEGIA